MLKGKVLVAAANWGLGHASRCIPVINALIAKGFSPVLASDGAALNLLQKEFPSLPYYQLPSYAIRYSRYGRGLKWKLLGSLPQILSAIASEKQQSLRIHEKENLVGIISDSRFGIRVKEVPNVFITHQLQVLSGITTCLSTKIHSSYIRQFDQCWIPDSNDGQNLSGYLGHSSRPLKKNSLSRQY